jgi:hypothetical protein
MILAVHALRDGFGDMIFLPDVENIPPPSAGQPGFWRPYGQDIVQQPLVAGNGPQ